MNELPQQLANGLILGAMYGLIAVGYTMVYGIIQLINFAHGEIFMIGGFGALTVYLWLPSGFSLLAAIPLMILGGVLCSVAISVAAERFAYRPLRSAPRLAPDHRDRPRTRTPAGRMDVVPRRHQGPLLPQFKGEAIDIFGAGIQRGDLFVLIAAPVCMFALGLFVSKTRAGRGMQATSQDPDTAKLMGINTDRIIVMAFAIGAAFAAVAAVAYGLKSGQIGFRMGFIMGLKAFTAAVLGGIGNIYGAMLGGVVLGIAESLATGYMSEVPGMELFGGGAWKDVWAFVLLILVLLIRPQGLLGERVADRA
ncbi:branched-chain amino acid ABC transporter permease [Streptomyces sp. M10(2022)]